MALSVNHGAQALIYWYGGDVRRRTEQPGLTLAERKRQLVRDELADAALRLLAKQGFEATTVDELAAAAGVSRRTFFRYFASKEDVVISSVVVVSEGILSEVEARPADESPAVAIREAVKMVTVEDFAQDREKSVALIRHTQRVPALRARFAERLDLLRDDLALVLARRAGRDTPVPRDHFAAGLGLLAFAGAMQYWADTDGRADPAGVLDLAFEEAGQAFVV
ncbi:TetR family transcriptional regulator [Catenulispora sp. NL8]|uniref:TetR family transcriptional regulator n=1 Tax=Catenulispora pinistramenti TaxID=2705254 RepID=A0ABS5L088_9ACTN|nr:TetR family transcriptional regulator [Catenulispora pinistramenti]MBS2551716.1 TetR family transcriptional regulator [Catenulispora pinistramenti]